MRYLALLSFFSLFLTGCFSEAVFYDKDNTNYYEETLDSLNYSFWFSSDYAYAIQRGDKIAVSVWDHIELSVGTIYEIYSADVSYGKFLLVDENGNISLPKIGLMKVVGMTEGELAASVREILRTWIKDPLIVDIRVLSKKITVMGEVVRPDVIPIFSNQTSIFEIVAEVGGFNYYADLRQIMILREDNGKVRVLNVDLVNPNNYSQNTLNIHPDDVVLVPPKRFMNFEKRITSVIPVSSAVTAAAILIK